MIPRKLGRGYETFVCDYEKWCQEQRSSFRRREDEHIALWENRMRVAVEGKSEGKGDEQLLMMLNVAAESMVVCGLCF